MSHPAHTPGPWRWHANPHGGARVVTTGVAVADVLARGGVPHPAQEHCEANARLISAAPDMLEALEALQHADKCFCDAGFAGPDHHPRHSDECEKARAAIDKAKGGAQ